MSVFLDPSGQPTYGIAICGRCSRKMLLSELAPDPNYPGLMVCEEDRDQYDPYRLAPRRPDQIVLRRASFKKPVMSSSLPKTVMAIWSSKCLMSQVI